MPAARANPVVPLVCHNCGAPLAVAPGQTLVLCPYCYASSRIEPSTIGPPQVTPAGTLPEEVADLIRQLLVQGKRDEAVTRYEDELQCTREQAAQAVQGVFERDVFFGLLAKQILRWDGVVIACLCVVAMVGSVVLLLIGAIHALVAVPAFGVALFVCPLRRLRTTLRYLGGNSGTARVKKLVWLGEMTAGNITLHCARLWVEVQPRSDAGFPASMNVVSRSKARFFEGETIEIKYLRGNPESVTLARMPAER